MDFRMTRQMVNILSYKNFHTPQLKNTFIFASLKNFRLLTKP
jgi:hypothetical protein